MSIPKPGFMEALAKAKCPYCEAQRVRVMTVSREGGAHLYEAKDGHAAETMSAVAMSRRAVAGCAACNMTFDPSRADLPEEGWTD